MKFYVLLLLLLLSAPAMAQDSSSYDPYDNWDKNYDNPFDKPDRKSSPYYEDPIPKEDRVRTIKPPKPIELENGFSDGRSGKKRIGSIMQDQLKPAR